MKKLLQELREESTDISTKNLSPIGFDYRRRTKLERLIFLVAKEYCKNNLNYILGGLGRSHQKMFSDYTSSHSYSSKKIENIIEAFKVSELICDLSASDPYTRDDAMRELGGSVYVIFDNLSKRIALFVTKIEKDLSS